MISRRIDSNSSYMKRWMPDRIVPIILGLILFLTVKCDDDENQSSASQTSDPCKTMSMMTVHCIANSPENEAFVNPAKIKLSWIATTPNPAYTVFLGISTDNLIEISKQSATTYVLTNLNLNTTYYWKVNAVNSCNYSCSTGGSFTTVPDTNLPFVITTPALTHTYSPPRLGGNVKYNGLSDISDRGICISLSSNPEITGTKYHIDKGIGLFSDLIPGLIPGTIYFVKAFATNNSGTSFGNEISFTTGMSSDYQSVKDIDGNIYYTVKIGDQTWLSENLRSTRFNDGTAIPNVIYEWNAITTPGYCWYNHNSGFKTTYGALYNFYTVDIESNGRKNVCPSGWHVPSKEEYSALINYLGGEAVAGIKLKEKGETYWAKNSPTTGDNSSGFSALPGGLRYNQLNSSYQQFYYIGQNAFWWSSTGMPNAYSMETGFNQSYAYINAIHDKKTGLAVRCIKDTR